MFLLRIDAIYISYSDIIDKPFKKISFTAVAKARLIDDELSGIESHLQELIIVCILQARTILEVE